MEKNVRILPVKKPQPNLRKLARALLLLVEEQSEQPPEIQTRHEGPAAEASEERRKAG